MHQTAHDDTAHTTLSEPRKAHAHARRVAAHWSLPLSKAGTLDHVSERRVERRRVHGCTRRVLTKRGRLVRRVRARTAEKDEGGGGVA